MIVARWLNFYVSWELFWPRDVTWSELWGAANDPDAAGVPPP